MFREKYVHKERVNEQWSEEAKGQGSEMIVLNAATEQADLTKNQLCTSWNDYNGTTTNKLASKYLAEVRPA